MLCIQPNFSALLMKAADNACDAGYMGVGPTGLVSKVVLMYLWYLGKLSHLLLMLTFI